MAPRNSSDKIFSPAGYSDAIDGTHIFPGACAALSNLIPDATTKNLWACRPAQTEITNFPGFNTPGFISCTKVIGTRVYGMISTARNANKDEPFVYDIPSGLFITVSGVTNGNTPSSPVTTGDWVPPTMALVGALLIVTHPGYTGAAGVFFGWFDLTNTAAPAWNGGNTTGIPLPFVPTAVANFNGRAHFAVNYADYITDPLTLNISNATHVLTFDDTVNITAFKSLSFANQLGGIVQALMVVKGTTNLYQIKGDFVTSDLTVNSMNYAIGSNSPLTFVDTPFGVMFVAPDGLRNISFSGEMTDPIGIAGDGMNVPLLNALVPSRVVAACNASILRISVQNAGKVGTPFEEYWFHISRKIWSGPHTFAPSLIQPYNTKFVTAPQGIVGKLFMSETFPSLTSVYTENGSQLNWSYTTVFLPDDGRMGVFNIGGEMTIKLSLDINMNSWTAYLLNTNNSQYDSVGNIVPNTAPIWDAAIWDAVVWDGVSSGLLPRLIKWDKPVISSRAQVNITGGSAAGVRIGDLKYTLEELAYVPEVGF